MIERRPGYLTIGLFDQWNQITHIAPAELREQLQVKVRAKLKGVFIHTRGEVAKVVDEAFEEIVLELKAQSIRR